MLNSVSRHRDRGYALNGDVCMRVMKIPEVSEWACIVEAGTFKPGNVYPGRKGFFDFVVSAVVLRTSLERICSTKEVHLGRCIKEAVVDRRKYVTENTNLGIILLYVPLAVAASRGGTRLMLEEILDELVHSTTTEDAVEVAEAVRMSNAFLGEPKKGPDVRYEKSMQEIQERGMTLLDLFRVSSEWDTIASEWVNGFEITFSSAERLLSGASVVQVYVEILSAYPDSLVQRRFGEGTAREISKKAKELLKDLSFERLKKWDTYLHEKGINPGTTADLVASSVFVSLLKREDLLKEFLDEIHQVYR